MFIKYKNNSNKQHSQQALCLMFCRSKLWHVFKCRHIRKSIFVRSEATDTIPQTTHRYVCLFVCLPFQRLYWNIAPLEFHHLFKCVSKWLGWYMQQLEIGNSSMPPPPPPWSEVEVGGQVRSRLEVKWDQDWRSSEVKVVDQVRTMFEVKWGQGCEVKVCIVNSKDRRDVNFF